jgi:hypothetical protein
MKGIEGPLGFTALPDPSLLSASAGPGSASLSREQEAAGPDGTDVLPAN